MKYKYDVFISYSRRDYVDESYNVIPGNAIAEIQNVFDENGITYWFDKDGIYSGQEFIEIITGAIAESRDAHIHILQTFERIDVDRRRNI